MDAMGSGRPIVATAIPECRLHAERFHVAEDAGEFLARSARSSISDSDDGRAALRHAYAVANTCRGVGERLLDLIDGRIGRDERDDRDRPPLAELPHGTERDRRQRPMATGGAGR